LAKKAIVETNGKNMQSTRKTRKEDERKESERRNRWKKTVFSIRRERRMGNTRYRDEIVELPIKGRARHNSNFLSFGRTFFLSHSLSAKRYRMKNKDQEER